MRSPVLVAALVALTLSRAHAADAILFEDTFTSYTAIADTAAAWDLSGPWELRDFHPPPAGKPASRGQAARSRATATAAVGLAALALATPGSAVAVAFPCPEVAQGQVGAKLRVAARTRQGSWAAAGLMLYQGPDHYWRLALVESPAGEHYCELVERYYGVWQAQSSGRTTLPSDLSASDPWDFDRTYDLRITIAADSVTGQVFDGRRLVFARTYHLDARAPAVRSGRPALEVIDMDAAFDDVTAAGQSPLGARPAQRPVTAAVLAQPGAEQLARRAAQALRQAGVETRDLDPADLAHPEVFSRARCDLLILPRCEAIPGPGKDNLLAFLRSGGHLIAFGGPPFDTMLWPWRGEWSPAQDILTQVRAEAPIIDFAHADLSAWTRATSDPGSPVEHKIVPGPAGRSALEVRVGDLTGWETFASPPLDEPFGEDSAITCLWAKGGPRTDHVVVEWDERDGSRWIATIDLSPEWRHYALRAEDFKFWRDSPTLDRGGPGDVFNPRQAERMCFGLAHSHAPIPPGEHLFWVAEIGAAPSPFGPADPEPPTLEAMSPWYKVYATELDAARDRIAADPEQRVFAPLEPVAVSARLISPVWRRRGLGSGAGQRGRWIPLLRATADNGDYRGAAASTYLATWGPYRGATWTYIGLDPQTVCDNWGIFEPVVVGVARRLAGGLMLTSAGADLFSYFADDAQTAAPRLVARIAGIGPRPAQARVRLTITDADGQLAFDHSQDIALDPGGLAQVSAPGPSLAPGRYRAACELIAPPAPGESDAPIDRISHEFSVIAPPAGGAPPAQPQFVTVRDGDFYLGAKKWYPHGLNFWPSYVAGLERFDYWVHWLTPSQYDPEPVERNLAQLEALGANMVSVQYASADQAPALADFLERAKSHGIRVNVFLPGAHPLAIDEALVEELVRAARLADSDAVFAYDLAWEPRLGPEQERRQYDDKWAAWIEERYGSIEAAERDWGFPAPRIDGRPTGPTDKQLLEDGPYRRMVAAYRRFADDLISQGYGRVTRLLRRLDPHHLFGARTGYGGTGQRGVAAVMPFDMISGAAHLDFASPEGWGLAGEWENFERAGFTTLYGRWASGGKPVFWSEFGDTIYPGTTPERYDRQGAVYRNLYHMVLQSHANGSAGWWYPGGLRVDENSDFGVINPDGTTRPAALELRDFAPQITSPRDRPQPDDWIIINRDAHVSGYAGVWDRGAAEYVAAVRAGKTVGLRTAADGATSADVPLIAVGGTPCNGANPPQYLNAEFGEVWVLDAADGAEAPVSQGAVIQVAAGRPIRLRVQLVNTGVAAWLSLQSAGGKPGGVYVAAGERGGLQARAAIPRDVPRYGTTEFEFTLTDGIAERTDVTLALLAARRAPRLRSEPAPSLRSGQALSATKGQAWFGQRLHFVLEPVAGPASR